MKKVLHTKWLFLPLFLMFFAGCEKEVFEPVVIPDETISFATDIQPIFSAHCVSCHPPTKGIDLTTGHAYESLVPAFVSVADTANPEGSKLYKQLTSTSHSPRTSELEKQTILKWISQGAQDN
jgi:hypothetical protein